VHKEAKFWSNSGYGAVLRDALFLLAKRTSNLDRRMPKIAG